MKKTENSETMYLLRSSVLGGAVINEIYGTANQFFGQKQKGHVYANGRELAEQNPFLGQAINTPTDPSGLERIGSLGTQLDPLGDDVGEEDPYLPDGGGDPGFNYPHMGDMSDPSSGCTVDGQPWNCTQLFKVFNANFVSKVERGPFSGEGSGFDPWLNGSLKWIDDWRPKHVDHPPDDPDVAVVHVYTDIYNGHWEWVPGEDQHFAHAPQKPVPVPLPGTDAIKNRLTGDCNAYIASLLAKASELYGGQGNVAVAKDGLDLLNKIGSGGFVLKDFLKIDGYPVGGTVTGSIAGNNTFAAGSATVLVSTRFMYGNSAATVAMWQANYVSTAIHEMLHLAGRYGGYDDTQLATAASKLPGAAPGLLAPPKNNQDMNGILNSSGYYNSELMKHCGPK